MASMMGRSCGYGIHLRSYLPAPVTFSLSSSSSVSFSRLASSFFLHSSSSSFRIRRLRLCTAPPQSSPRNVVFIHGSASQKSISGASLPPSHPSKSGSSRKKRDASIREAVAEENSTSPATTKLENFSSSREGSVLVSSEDTLASPKKYTRRRKKDDNATLQGGSFAPSVNEQVPSTQSGEGKQKKVTRRKSKDDNVTLQSLSSDLFVDGKVELSTSRDGQPTLDTLTSPKKATARKKKEDNVTLQSETSDPVPKNKSKDGQPTPNTLPSPKKVTRKKKKENSLVLQGVSSKTTGDDILSSSTSVDEQPILSIVASAKKGTRRKRTDDEQALQAVPPMDEKNDNQVSGNPPTRRKKKNEDAKLLSQETISSSRLQPDFSEFQPHFTSDDKLPSIMADETTSPKGRKKKNITLPLATSGTKKVSCQSTSPIDVEDSTSLGRKSQPLVADRNSFLSETITSRPTPSEAMDVNMISRTKSYTVPIREASKSQCILPVDEEAKSRKTKEKVIGTFGGPSLCEVRNVDNSTDNASVTDDLTTASNDLYHSSYKSNSSSNDERWSELEFIFEDFKADTFLKRQINKEPNKDSNKLLLPQQSSTNSFYQKHEIQERNSTRQASKHAYGEQVRAKNNVYESVKPFKKGAGLNEIGHNKSDKDKRVNDKIQFKQKFEPKKFDSFEKNFKHGGYPFSSKENLQPAKPNTNGNQYLANMDRASGTERKGRKEFSIRNVVANQASTISYMQIYGTGFDTGDTVPTVLLFFDRRRFIFNVGEGLHRFCMEHRFKLSKIDHVFLTRICSENTGGLPGLVLTLGEMGETGLTVQTWGPSKLQDLAKALRTFLPSSWMKHIHCFGSEENDSRTPILLLEDELIKISSVLLHPREDNIDSTSTVYICELSEVKGRFDPAKALAKGLKPGYKYGKLQRGESVMSDDGTTMVHPEEVLGPSSPGPIMILVDCPSLSHVPSLVSSKSLQDYFSGSGKIVNCMVHISPQFVTSSKDYQYWMQNFSDTHHIMAWQQLNITPNSTLESSTKMLSKLNFICPHVFPLMSPKDEEGVDIQNLKGKGENTLIADNLLKYHFRPLSNLGPDGSDIPEEFDPVAAQKQWDREREELWKAKEIAQRVFSECLDIGYKDRKKFPPCLQDISREEMELVFLGTGSSQPSKHRNVTGIYIHMFQNGGFLLDCGEGTYAQLKRRYGANGADNVLMSLKFIWISHLHADHFSGLTRILSARRKLLEMQKINKPILVVGPKKLKVFLDAYEAIEDLHMVFLDCSQTTFEVESFIRRKEEHETSGRPPPEKGGLIHKPLDGYPKRQMQHFWMQPGFHIQQGVDIEGRNKLKTLLSSIGLQTLFSVPVVHCPNAFAVVIEARERKTCDGKTTPGWKLVFSGDTRPCQALIEAARGSTILIHEATFDDGMLEEAVKKNHSMTKEAIEVGVSADAYRIFLTHFSQRYPKVPVFDKSHNDRTCIAFDMMSVNLADLHRLPRLLPAFQLVFKDEFQEDVE